VTTGADRLTADRARRLALVRVLLEQGRESVRDPAPFGALGLLPLHDAVEIFLHVAAEALGARVRDRTQFLPYFELIDAQLPTENPLAERSAMDRLNEARVGLKHRGLLPDHGDLAGHSEAVDRFFAHNVPLVFGRELTAISLVALVRDADVRKEMEDAERHLAADEFSAALEDAAVAVQRSLVRAGVTGPGDAPASPWASDPDVARAIAELEALITIQGLRIDDAAYRAFRTITPSVAFSRAGSAQIRWTGLSHPERDQVEVALQFATSLVLRVEDGLAGVERTYKRFGVVRVGNSLVTRHLLAHVGASPAAAEGQQQASEQGPEEMSQ
jgi:hypothetical protein